MKTIKSLIFAAAIILFCALSHAHAESFIEEYIYQASDSDSKITCRAISLMQAKRLLLGKIGTYLKSYTAVVNAQLERDEIIELSAGVVKAEILDEQWDGKTYKLVTKIEVDPEDVSRQIALLRENNTRTSGYEDVNKKYLDKINELRKNLEDIQNNFIEVTKDYAESSRLVDAWDAFDTGMQNLSAGDYELAIENFDTSIAANPNYNAYFNRGKAYSKLKEYPKAIEDFDVVVRLNPLFAGAYWEKGHTLVKSGKKKEGLSEIKKAAKMGNGNAKRWLRLKGK